MIANIDLLVGALRDRMPDGPVRRGFYIGMAASASHTAWTPGNHAILASLGRAEQEGFKVAVSFALDRNRHADLAAVAAAIAETDGAVGQARTRDGDVRYWLGF
jgi:hypothetical protein